MNEVCNRFEAAWRDGDPRPVEAFLEGAGEAERSALARELVLLDIHYRRQAGQAPRVEDYRDRFPALGATWLVDAVRTTQATRVSTLLAGVDGAAGADLPPLAGHELLGEVGHGGMGVVYRARDAGLGRDLAVKVLRQEHRGRADITARFFDEAHIAGGLQHPGVVPIHALARLPDGRPCFTMKLVQGRTLAELLAERAGPAQDLPRFLNVFEQVCQTLAYAHSRGVIHRDLKPGNVMVGAFGEVQVMDWGLAKVLARPGLSPAADIEPAIRGDGAQTQTGAVLGTPAYMAPEQARGEVERLDERCDVFSLGALLCELLTGAPAYRGESGRDECLQAEGAELGDALGRLDGCGADAELVALAKHCLAAEPEARPRDAGAVAAAVRAYLDGVQDRLRRAEVGRAEAQVKATEERKRRRVTGALAGVMLVLVAAGGGGAWWYQRESDAKAAALAVRRTDTEREVTAALREASALNEEGWKEKDFPDRWQATVKLAAKAVEAAVRQLAIGVATEELQAQVKEVREAVEKARSASQLCGRLDRIRMNQAALSEGHFDMRAAVPLYATELRIYGVDPGNIEASAAIVRGSGIDEALVAALKDWSRWTLDRAEQQQLDELLRTVDPDSDAFRARWRAAWEQRDCAALAALAREPEVQGLPAAALCQMARDLEAMNDLETAERLLRAGQERFRGDFWLNADLARLLTLCKPSRAEQAVPYLMAALAVRFGSPGVHVNLGIALRAKGDRGGAIRAFRDALTLDRNYVAAHSNLGVALFDIKDFDSAISACRAALTIDPQFAVAHNTWGNALFGQGNWKDAIEHFRIALALDPQLAAAHVGIGRVLRSQNNLSGAISAFHDALALDPDFALAHYNLGDALFANGDPDGALRCYRTALAHSPRLAMAFNKIGIVFQSQKNLDGAIRAFHDALALDPDFALAHYNLGNALRDNNDLKGAIRAYRDALALDCNFAPTHNNLGNVLNASGDPEGAIEHYRAALALDPQFALAHYNLGHALCNRGDLEEGILHYRCAVDIDTAFAEAYCDLGIALWRRGDFSAALVELRRGHELGSKKPDWPHKSDQWIKQCEGLLALDGKLPAVLKGEAKPADAAEATALADICLSFKQLPAAAARLYVDALAADPTLADAAGANLRYNAARAAAFAAAGQGKDTEKLDDQARARLRTQALDWLRADLALRTKQLDDGKPADRALVRQAMQTWQKAVELASVRGDAALAKLPDAEREAWRKLWNDVAALLGKTGGEK
jgi:tetratricopeptide (TPR) repeat protein